MRLQDNPEKGGQCLREQNRPAQGEEPVDTSQGRLSPWGEPQSRGSSSRDWRGSGCVVVSTAPGPRGHLDLGRPNLERGRGQSSPQGEMVGRTQLPRYIASRSFRRQGCGLSVLVRIMLFVVPSQRLGNVL